MEHRDDPTGEELVRGQQPPNPYAVPLAVLVAGPRCRCASQTTVQPVDDLRFLDGGGGGVEGDGGGDGD